MKDYTKQAFSEGLKFGFGGLIAVSGGMSLLLGVGVLTWGIRCNMPARNSLATQTAPTNYHARANLKFSGQMDASDGRPTTERVLVVKAEAAR